MSKNNKAYELDQEITALAIKVAKKGDRSLAHGLIKLKRRLMV
jgi:hypothetical protein